jgi:transposase-like protein
MKAQESSFYQWQEKFSTTEKCPSYLAELGSGKVFQCHHYGHDSGYWTQKHHRYECAKCNRRVSTTAGTLFHGTKLPLTKWFWAVYLTGSDKGGISALRLSKFIGVTWRSAFRMLTKLRTVMGHRDSIYRLSEVIELDDA